METIENVLEKIKEGERIKTLSNEINQMELDLQKVTITTNVQKVRITVNEDQLTNYVDIQFRPTELIDILKSKIELKKNRLQKLLNDF